MASELHYKDDSTFRRYLVMASVGELAAIDLMRAGGHDFRLDGLGAGSAHIFKDEARKKKRTADLRCARCGQKLEVRAKSRLAIRMSHSEARPFDGEFQPADWVGFLSVNLSSRDLDPFDPGSYGKPASIFVTSIANLVRAGSHAELSAAKSRGKGSESYLTWPSLVAPVDGVIVDIRYKGREQGGDESRIVLSTAEGEHGLYPPPGSYLARGLTLGSRVRGGETVLASVVKALGRDELQCKGAPA